MNQTLFMTIAALCFAPLTAAENTQPVSIFEKMDETDKKMTGIDKLSTEEKTALESWYEKNTAAAAADKEKSTAKESAAAEFEITEISGLTFTLSDKNAYEVSPSYKKKVKKWQEGDKIQVIPSKKANSYKLENTRTDQQVGAKKVLKKEVKEASLPDDES